MPVLQRPIGGEGRGQGVRGGGGEVVEGEVGKTYK